MLKFSKEEYDKIASLINKHKETITIDDQVLFVVYREVGLLKKLINKKRIPRGVVGSLLTINDEIISKGLLKSGKIESVILEKETMQDGIWLIKKGSCLKYIDQEHGAVFEEKNFDSVEDASLFIAKRYRAYFTDDSNKFLPI